MDHKKETKLRDVIEHGELKTNDCLCSYIKK